MPWNAPAAGTGSVALYGIINAVNGDGNTSGDTYGYASNNGQVITEAVNCPTVSIIASGASLVANVSGATATGYQWYNNGTPISGATSSSYTAIASGSYTVAVTAAGGCSVTSSPQSYIAAGINELAGTQNGVKVYPTVANDHLTVSFDLKESSKVNIYLLSIQGQTVRILQADETAGSGAFNRSFDMNGLATGIYLVKIQIGDNYSISKVVKE